MLLGRSSLYVTNSRTFKILKGSNLAKSNLLLSRVIQINIIFVLNIFYRRYTLFLSLRVNSLTFLLSINFLIILLKNTKFQQNLFCSSWISSTIITVYSTNSSYFLIFIETSASNPLFMKNRVLLVILCSKVLYTIIPIGNNLTQLVYQQSQKHLRYYSNI